MSNFHVRGDVSLDGSGVSRTLGSLKHHFKAFGSEVKGMIAGAFTAEAVVEFSKKTIELGAKIADLSERFKISKKSIQEWKYAAEQGGSSLDAVANFLKHAKKSMAESLSNPKGEEADFFSRIGFSPEDVRKGQDDFDNFSKAIARKLKQFDVSEPLIEKMFGKSSGELIPMFEKGLDEAANKAHALGIVLSDEVVDALKQISDETKDLIAQFQGPFATALAAIAKTLVDVAKTSGLVIQNIEKAAKDEKTSTISKVAEVAGLMTMLTPMGLATAASASIASRITGKPNQMLQALGGGSGGGSEGDVPKPGEAGFIGPMPERKKVSSDEISTADREAADKEMLKLQRGEMTTAQKRASLEKQMMEAFLKAKRLGGTKEGVLQLKEGMGALGELQSLQAPKVISDSMTKTGNFLGDGGVRRDNSQREMAINIKKLVQEQLPEIVRVVTGKAGSV